MTPQLPRLAPGPNRLGDRFTRDQALVRRLVGASTVELVSCVAWRTGPGWSIPRRSCLDALLFVPLAGMVEVRGSDGWQTLAPGQVVLIPDRAPHQLRLAPGHTMWETVALHLHWRDQAGTPLAHGCVDWIHDLPDPTWRQRALDLTALAGAGPEGEAVATIFFKGVMLDLLAAGLDFRVPVVGDPRIGAALRAIHADPDARLAVTDLARIAGLSPARFRVHFQAMTGMGPKAYQDRQRLTQVARRLHRGDEALAAIARDLGFANPKHLHQRFKAAFGCTPGAWRRRAVW